MNLNTNKAEKIAVVGLGYVGLPLAVAFGMKLDTLGFDTNLERIQALKSGKDSTLEVAEDYLKSASKLTYSSNASDLNGCNIFLVTVPTPIDGANRPDLSPLINATKIVGKALESGGIVVFESTVYPGCTEEICVPVLEKESGLTYNKDFFCGYSPERINPGDKVNTLTKIVKITSGSTPEVATKVDALYASIVVAGTFKASSIAVAEAAKVIENTQRDLNIALVNELSIIFERLGIDTIDVLEAAGSKWNFLTIQARPCWWALYWGRPILFDASRPSRWVITLKLFLAGRRINDGMAQYMVKKVVQKMLINGIDVTKSTVGVLGITFKENCPDVRNSKIFDVVSELKNWGVNVVCAILGQIL